MRILVIEDDRRTQDYIVNGLVELGHVVDRAADGRVGLDLIASGSYDVAIVDRMVPGLDGLALVKAARSLGVATPALFLTALGGVGDRVAGLDAGGDDYLVKPFAFSELAARVNALARRPRSVQMAPTLRLLDLELDPETRSVRRAGKPIELQAREFALLEFLMRHAGRVVTRSMLLEHVWDLHFDPKTNVVDTQISRLRGKIDKGFEPPLLHTVRGSGYVLRAPE